MSVVASSEVPGRDAYACSDCNNIDNCPACKVVQSLVAREQSQSQSLWDFIKNLCQQEEAAKEDTQRANQAQKQAIWNTQQLKKRLRQAEKGWQTLTQELQKDRTNLHNLQGQNTQLLSALNQSESKLDKCTASLHEEIKKHKATAERSESLQKENLSARYKLDIAWKSFSRMATFFGTVSGLANPDVETGIEPKAIKPGELIMDTKTKMAMVDDVEKRLFHTIGALKQHVRTLEEELQTGDLQKTAAINSRDAKILKLEGILEAVQKGAHIRRPRSSRSHRARHMDAISAPPETRARSKPNADLSEKGSLERVI